MTYSTSALYGAAQIRAAEAVAFERYGVDSLQLMRQAGQAAFAHLRRRWPEARRIAVCCGSGNNGGDGYVLASLALQAGMQVRLQALGDITALRHDALACSREFVANGGRIDDADGQFADCELIVDALLGTGLNRPVAGDYLRLIDAINAAGKPVLALDLPSGLNADSGAVMGAAVRAELCVTFIALKCGLLTGVALDHYDELALESLGIPVEILHSLPACAHIYQDFAGLPKRWRNAHKGHFGHVLLVGGNLGYSGALRLAAEAALRCGAGLVSLATRTEHASLLNIGRPELMCHGIETPVDMEGLLQRCNVVVIGPGLGQDAWALALFERMLASDLLLVVDADALNLLAQSSIKRDNWLLTPHPGEAGRLLNCTASEISADRYQAVSRLQQRYGGVCVLKGAGSLVADGETITVNITGNPGMASGGMGDVLAGICGALLAQGYGLADVARRATYLHGKAGDLAADRDGERGMLASDLLSLLRELLN